MSKKIVFISHIAEEKEIALELKVLIESSFLGMIDIFVSSDYESVHLGRKWLDDITSSLRNCDLEIIVCSPKSVERPWINFEAGAGWIRDIDVIPLCHSGMEPANLPVPLNLLQAGKATEESSLKGIFQTLANTIGSKIPNADFGVFIDKVKNFEVTEINSDSLISKISGKKLPEPSLPELSEEAKEILIELSQDSEGDLWVIKIDGNNFAINTNEKSLADASTARSRAVWLDAVDQLVGLLLIKYASGEVYSITTRGYQVADELKTLQKNSSLNSSHTNGDMQE